MTESATPALPGLPAHFGDAAAEYRAVLDGVGLFDTSDHGHIEVAGKDAGRFLHNLTTNDIVALAPGGGCEAFCATHKARAVAYVHVYRLPGDGAADVFWVETGSGRGAFVFRHLDKYLVSESLELTDRTAEFGSLYLAGPRAAAVLAATGFDAADSLAPNGVVLRTSDGVTYQLRRKDLLGVPGFTVVGPRAALPGLWQRFTASGAQQVGKAAYETLRVEAGTPEYGPDIDEERFVVEVARGAAAISTNKGCYLGQEPIVMARDRGQVNRQLLGVRFVGGEPLPHGTKLFKETAEVGLVTSAVLSPRFGAIALAYIRRGNQEPDTVLEAETASGRLHVTVSALPFRTTSATPA